MEELKEFEEKPSLFKKILIITLSIFLLILLLFYFLTSPQTKSIIYGFIESSKLIGNKIEIDKNTKLIFNDESLTTLNNLYNQNLEKEFKVCLKGIKINNT